MLPARILGTASALPGAPMDTEDLLARCRSGRTAAQVEERTGIRTRHHAPPEVTVASLGAQVLTAALADAGVAPTALRRLILVTSSGGDALIPANANAVLERLGLAGTCDGFDLNNACMGFLTGLDVAARCAATGLAPVAVVAVELLSRFLTPEDERPWLVLADAAGAAVVGASGAGGAGGDDPGAGFLGGAFGNDGALRGSVALAHPGLTGARETIRFAASNREIGEAAIGGLVRSARAALDAAGLGIDDVDHVVPHQPNGSMLRQIVAALGVREDRIVPVVEDIGSVGAASVAVGLDVLRRRVGLRPGARVLLVGVGAGMAHGALVYREGTP